MTEEERIGRLSEVKGVPEVVIDTDAGCEIDDQFALSYALRLRKKGRLSIGAIYAAPFRDERKRPDLGEADAYNEIQRILALDGAGDIPVFHGATHYSWQRMPEGTAPADCGDFLKDCNYDGPDGGETVLGTPESKGWRFVPVESDASRDLIARGMARTPEDPLYVVAIGTCTNIAAALAWEPRLAERLTVLILVGHGQDFPDNHEFNLSQDPLAVNFLLSSGVPVVHFPCAPVVSHLSVSLWDIERLLGGRNPLADYLCEISGKRIRRINPTLSPTTVLWDVIGFIWLIHPEWLVTKLMPTPLADGLLGWRHPENAPLWRECVYVLRDPIINEVFGLLAEAE